jgi:hypothetical protein
MIAFTDTGPPPERRATPLPTRGAGIGARPSTRYIRGEINPTPQVAQRCRVTLHRTGNVTFASRLNLEDGDPCRVTVVWSNQQLKFHLRSLARLSWASTVLWPSENPDFSVHLSWENRRYHIGIHVRLWPCLCLQMFMRPLHLHRTTNQNAQLEEDK